MILLGLFAYLAIGLLVSTYFCTVYVEQEDHAVVGIAIWSVWPAALIFVVLSKVLVLTVGIATRLQEKHKR